MAAGIAPPSIFQIQVSDLFVTERKAQHRLLLCLCCEHVAPTPIVLDYVVHSYLHPMQMGIASLSHLPQ